MARLCVDNRGRVTRLKRFMAQAMAAPALVPLAVLPATTPPPQQLTFACCRRRLSQVFERATATVVSSVSVD